jgi:hypothetical protein
MSNSLEEIQGNTENAICVECVHHYEPAYYNPPWPKHICTKAPHKNADCSTINRDGKCPDFEKIDVRQTCSNCENYLYEGDGRIWYNQYCKAHPFSKAIDYVTGKMQYVSEHGISVGEADREDVWGKPPYAHCRDVRGNKPSCSEFVPKKIETKHNYTDYIPPTKRSYVGYYVIGAIIGVFTVALAWGLLK